MPRAPRTISPNRLAVELAATLSPTIAAPVAALCLDFKCRPAALKQAARELTDNGVHAHLTADGWIADPATWPACQRLGQQA